MRKNDTMKTMTINKTHKQTTPKNSKDVLFRFPDQTIPPWEFAKGNYLMIDTAYKILEQVTGTRKYWLLNFEYPNSIERFIHKDPLVVDSPFVRKQGMPQNDNSQLGIMGGHNFVTRLHEGILFLNLNLQSIDGHTNGSMLAVSLEDGKIKAEERLDSLLRFYAKEVVSDRGGKEKTRQDEAMRRLILPSDIKQEIITEIDSFIKGRQAYMDLGLQWKRGIVLYGPPGNGKTSCLKALGEYFNLNLLDLSRRLNQSGDPVLASGDMACSKEGFVMCELNIQDIVNVLYPNIKKPSLYYIEDLDKQVAGGNGTDLPKMRLSSLLNMIDGVDEVDGALFIATTNYANELAEALMSRPGRFDSIYEIGAPGHEQIMEMFNLHKLTVDGKSPEKLARDLKGYSMAFIEECVKVAKMIHKTTDLSNEQAASVLKKIVDHNQKYRKHFKNGGGVGFAQ